MKIARRPAAVVAVLLLAGAVVNMGVAWACVGAAAPPGVTRTFVHDGEWPRPAHSRWPLPRIFDTARSRGLQVESAVTYLTDEDGYTRCTMRLGRAGWPLHAFQWESWSEERWMRSSSGVMAEGHPGSLLRHGFACPDLLTMELSEWKRLPILPIWAGWAINTMVYAALAAGAWLGPGAVRRVVRRRRGLCARCGYSRAGLGEGAACPECGSGEHSRSAKQQMKPTAAFGARHDMVGPE